MKFRAQRQLAYHYWGLVFGKLTVKVKMVSVQVEEGHAAVWAGINGVDNVSWVQGGIAAFPGGQVQAYIEEHQYGKNPEYFGFDLPNPEAVVTVKLIRVSWHHWKVRISYGETFHESKVIYIKGRQTIDACLEIWGFATVLCTINGKTVKGSVKQ